MAYTTLVRGVQREIFREAANQGPGLQTVVTGIRISAAKLACVKGLLTIDPGTVGAPALTAVPQVGATGFLEVAVTNLTGGTLANWTLDVQLMQSPEQANRGAVGYIQVASGVTGGLAGSQTLAQTYNVGTLPAHQTMVIDDVAHGGGVVFDASTAAATVANPAVDVRQSNAVLTPLRASKCGNDAVGPLIELRKARGTYAAPVILQTGDVVGDIDFVGYLGAIPGFTQFGRIECYTVQIDESVGMALDFYGGNDTGLHHAWRMESSGSYTWLTGYGDTGVYVRTNTNDVGYLGETGHIWHEINASQENLYHASGDAVSSYLTFYKTRGTLAVPANVNTNDSLGWISFHGYVGGDLEGARIASEVTSVAGGLGASLNFYGRTPLGIVTRIARMDVIATPTYRLLMTNPAEIIPATWPNTSTIGNALSPWREGYFTNLLVATGVGAAVGGGATGTLLLNNDSVMPVPQANQVYLGALDYNTVNFPALGAALALSAEAAAQPINGYAATALIPCTYNGSPYMILAYADGG